MLVVGRRIFLFANRDGGGIDWRLPDMFAGRVARSGFGVLGLLEFGYMEK